MVLTRIPCPLPQVKAVCRPHMPLTELCVQGSTYDKADSNPGVVVPMESTSPLPPPVVVPLVKKQSSLDCFFFAG